MGRQMYTTNATTEQDTGQPVPINRGPQEATLHLLPLCAVAIITPHMFERMPHFGERARLFNARHPDLLAHVYSPEQPGQNGLHLLTIYCVDRVRRVMQRVLDETEFLGDYGDNVMDLENVGRQHF